MKLALKRPLFCASLFVAAFIALLRYGPWHGTESEILTDGEKIVVTGEVCEKTSESFTIEIITIEMPESGTSAENGEKLTGRRLICVPESAETLPAMGCAVRCSGTFRAYSHATNPGEFDYADYYRAIGVEGRLKNAVISARTDGYSRLRETLYRLRCYWRARFYSVFPEKEASVMTALLLGDREGLDEDIKLLYKRSGILHILSISGLHISLIGLGIYKLLRRVRIPGIPAAVLSCILLLLYGIMTGMGISVRRAVGMFLIQMAARIVGRTYDLLTALGVMAAVVVVQNPACLELMAFWLSFGSVLGIGCLLPALQAKKKPEGTQEQETEEAAGQGERYREGWRKRVHDILVSLWKGLRDELLAGVSATCTTLPILLIFTYELPVYAIFLNILILPFMKTLLYVGLFVMLIPGTGLVGTIDSLILAGYEGLCRWFGGLPFHTWNPGCPEKWAVIGYYLLWLTVISLRGKGLRLRGPLLAAAAALIGLHLPAASSVTFLDVGQGDCICLRLSSGEVYLFDCGSTSRSSIGERVLIPYLKYYGIRELTAVLVSHPDADHMNGIVELLEASGEEHLTIDNLILPEIEEAQRGNFDELLTIEGDWNVDYVSAGEGWMAEEGSGQVSFLCLAPQRLMGGDDTNAWSECFYITAEDGDAGRQTLLLTGDVQAEGEESLTAELARRGIDRVGVLKVAHHGSRNSTTEAFLAQLTPDAAIISCGKNNSYGHPHAELLERLEGAGAEILRTDESGAITLRLYPAKP